MGVGADRPRIWGGTSQKLGRIDRVWGGRGADRLWGGSTGTRRFTLLMVISGTVYRLTSSMIDHTLVLFNVFEDWNEESVVLHICFA